MKPKSLLCWLSLSVAALMFSTMAGCGGGGGGGNADLVVVPPADLSLTKTVDNTTPAVGDTVVFTLTVLNSGPSPATGVVVTDKLPTGFKFSGYTSTTGTYDSASGAWVIGSVAVGAAYELSLSATVNPAGVFTNRAEITASNQRDPNPANNFDGVVAAPAGISVTINQIQTACETNTTSNKAYVTVVDQLKNPVTSTPTFTLTESLNSIGYAVNNFSVATNNANSTMAFVLDYSESIFDSGVITAMKTAAIEFINQLAAGDEAQIITFNETVTTFPANNGFTSDKNLLISAVENAPAPTAPGTELYNAIILGIDNTSLRPTTNNRAVVVVTDGRNNVFPLQPNINVDTAIADAQATQIPVYTVGVGAESDWDELIQLATETKGEFFPSFQPDDLTEIFSSLADILNSQYVITYASALPGGANDPGTLTVGADVNGLTGNDTQGYALCP